MAKVASSPSGNQPATMVLVATDGKLRVEFHWRHDRYEHVFLTGENHQPPATSNDAARSEPILGRSVEGDSENDWPPSPPIQQLSAETIQGENVLLGVGAAGKSHWSISVETQTIDDAAVLKFDLACRCKSQPQQLGSSYQLGPQLSVEPLEAAVIEDQGQRITIRPSAAESTYRWSYLVRRTQ